MKVSGTNVGPSLGGVESAKSQKLGTDNLGGGAKPDKANSQMGMEKVNLSEQAQSMQKARELATPEDTVNEAKVARLQKMIDEGTYTVDAEALADRLVDSHLGFPD